MTQLFRRIWPCLALLGAFVGLFPRAAHAATLPASFEERVVASGLNDPTAMAFAPDGRLFICEHSGTVRVVKNGAKLAAPFVSLAVASEGERGLLGIAFDPDFAVNKYVYLYYTTRLPEIHNRVSRFTANGDVAVAGSETILLELDDVTTIIHNGGALRFGPGGRLFIAVGEDGRPPKAQSLDHLGGKILRINKDGSIPTDNPFYNTAVSKYRAIWALGLRNPYTFDIERGTGRMFINDVGNHSFEEINHGIAGSNYGWPETEGATSDPRFRSPVLAYPHEFTDEGGCAVTGGAFYNAPQMPFPSAYRGKYFYADHCVGWIRTFDQSTGESEPFATGVDYPVDLKVDAQGGLNYLARGSNSVHRIFYSPSSQSGISITSQPQDAVVEVGKNASFNVTVSGEAPITYQWRRDGANIPGATAATYSLRVTASDDEAVFSVVVTNGRGSVTSRNATLAVSLNTAPSPTILAPTVGTRYSGGDEITYSGDATDAEEGALPDSAFSWKVVFHHGTHTHPFIDNRVGIRSGTFTIPTLGETATDVFYRITLTVNDIYGSASSVSRDIVPRVAQLQLRTNPPGLQVTLDGQPKTVPINENSVVGVQREIGAAAQTRDGVTYQFASWSDGGAATHTISTPAANTVYTANFRVVSDVRPTISFRTPTNGTAVNALSAVRGIAQSGISDASIARVYLYLQRRSDNKFWNGTTWTTSTPLATDLNGYGPRNWSRTTGLPAGAALPEGAYFMAARAYDTSGNAMSATLNFTVDKMSPTVAVTSPAFGSTVSSFNSVSGTTSDNGGSGVVRVEFFMRRNADNKWWNGSAWVATGFPLATTLAPISGGQSWRVSSPLPVGANLVDGTYLIGATTFDRVGNARNINGNFTLRRPGAEVSPSSIQLSSASAKADGTIKLTFTGALNASASDAANYTITSNEQAVAIASVSQPQQSTVEFDCTQLAVGARVSISYDIEDAQGRTVSGTANVVVK